MITGFLSAFLIGLVFPINLGGVAALSVYATMPKSVVGRWVIIVGGALGIAIVWISLFQDPASSTRAFIVAFVATALAAFLDIALLTWVLRYKVGWDTPFFEG